MSKDLIEVFKQKFWMKVWGHPNPKHSLMWATCPLIRCLALGPLVKSQRKSSYKSAVVYTDRRGQKNTREHAISSELGNLANIDYAIMP